MENCAKGFGEVEKEDTYLLMVVHGGSPLYRTVWGRNSGHTDGADTELATTNCRVSHPSSSRAKGRCC